MNETPDILQAIPELEREITANHFMADDFWIPVAWGIGIALVLAALALWLWFRRHGKQVQQPPSPAEIALDELAQLEADNPPLREYSLRLSMTLRRFLTGQTQDPALFETHEEFSQRMDALSSIPKACQNDTRRLLEGLAGLKYAGQQQHDPMLTHTLLEQARGLIGRITEAQQQEAAAAAELKRVQKMS